MHDLNRLAEIAEIARHIGVMQGDYSLSLNEIDIEDFYMLCVAIHKDFMEGEDAYISEFLYDVMSQDYVYATMKKLG